MTDDELPRPEVAPLPPPVGGFESVLHRARARRARRLVPIVGVLAVVALAGTVLATGGSGADDEVATADEPATTTTASDGDEGAARTTSSTTLVPAADTTTTTSTTTPHEPATTSTTATTAGQCIDWCGETPPPGMCCDVVQPPVSDLVHAGRTVDGDGHPLAGIYVYVNDGMIPYGAAAVTDADGRYEVACGSRPLLLWGVGPDFRDYPTTPDENWAPVNLGDVDGWTGPECVERGSEGTTTVMVPGAIATGLVFDADGELVRNLDGPGWTLTVDEATHRGLRIHTTDADGRYWLYGLPVGTLRVHNLGMKLTTIEASPGEVLAIDWAPEDDGITGPIIPGTPP
jgi:hypothetical protein